MKKIDNVQTRNRIPNSGEAKPEFLKKKLCFPRKSEFTI